MLHDILCTCSLSTCQSGRIPAGFTCGQVKWWVCRCQRHSNKCSRVFEDIHAYKNNLHLCMLTSSSTSRVPRCEKDAKAPPAKLLPKLLEVSFHVLRVRVKVFSSVEEGQPHTLSNLSPLEVLLFQKEYMALQLRCFLLISIATLTQTHKRCS